jgi:hypothetical protein
MKFMFLLLLLFAGFLGTALCSTDQLGSVTDVQSLRSCPTGFDFVTDAQCYQATITGCSGVANAPLYYGILEPSGSIRGTVVLHDGAGGRTAFIGLYPYSYPSKLTSAGFRVIQLAWISADWEDTGLSTKNIKLAACKPATIIHYLLTTYTAPSEALCALGYSGGAAAIGYALTYYGAGSYLDMVTLESGPAFGDVEKGCEIPKAPPLTVTPTDGASWQAAPEYTGGAITELRSWTGNATCQGKNVTSQQSDTAWKQMSNVDGSSDAVYIYPQTKVSGYICAPNGQNNSSTGQGAIYLQQIMQAAGFAEVRIDNCSGSEGTDAGSTPGGVLGFTASSGDLIAGCVKRH